MPERPYYLPTGDEIEVFAAAYAARLPVLLKGPTGCGKTRFIEHMAHVLHQGTNGTPHALVTLLRYMRTHPRGGLFFTSLPAPSGEGSLRARFATGPAAGRVHAKDGYIANVSSLSGYLTLPSDTLVFSILANNHGLEKSQAIAAIDSAVTLVAGAMQGR